MAVNIDGNGLIELGGTSSTQGRVRLAEDSDNGTNYIELTAPASVGSDRVITFPDGTGTAVVNGVNGSIVSGTSVASTSGTSIDFTGLPSYVKRITVMFNGVSLSGTSNYLIQIGSGSVTTSGYVSTGNFYNQANESSGLNSTAGFLISAASAASVIVSGQIVLTLLGSNTWVESHSAKLSTVGVASGGGNVTLSGTLDRVRITTVNGTDTFDAGSINILFE